jgi:hypothetical protein
MIIIEDNKCKGKIYILCLDIRQVLIGTRAINWDVGDFF